MAARVFDKLQEVVRRLAALLPRQEFEILPGITTPVYKSYRSNVDFANSNASVYYISQRMQLSMPFVPQIGNWLK